MLIKIHFVDEDKKKTNIREASIGDNGMSVYINPGSAKDINKGHEILDVMTEFKKRLEEVINV